MRRGDVRAVLFAASVVEARFSQVFICTPMGCAVYPKGRGNNSLQHDIMSDGDLMIGFMQ